MAAFNPTPAQMKQYGTLYDTKYRNQDIPDNPRPTMSRDEFIAQQAQANPNAGQSDFDRQAAGKKGRQYLQGALDTFTGNPIVGAAMGMYKDANKSVNDAIVNPAIQLPHQIANDINASNARQEYYDKYGQEAPDLNTAMTDGTPPGVLAPTQVQPEPSAQDVAQNKTLDLNADFNRTKQAVADVQARGGKVVPDVSQDPVGALAAMNSNKVRGLGDSAGSINIAPPNPPTAAEQKTMELNTLGQQSAMEQNKIPVWYKSDSFNYGLISFGLNLLSGNDLATSFGAAGKAFGDMFGQEKRGAWANDLAQKGYSPQEIEEYIRTGDSKVLSDPMEKQAKQIQMQANLQSLNNLQYEGSPEMRARNIQREDEKDSLNRLQTMSTIQNQNAQLGISQQRLALERQKQEAKEAGAVEEFGITNPQARMVLQQGKKFTDDSGLKRSRMAVAEQAALEGMKLLQAGNTAGAAAAYDQYEESYGKALQGGLGKINKDDAEEVAGPRALVDRYSQKVVRAARGAPTMGEFQRALESSQRGIKTEHTVVDDNLQSMYQNLVPHIGAERARAAAKFQATGAGIGNWEPRAQRATSENVTFH